MNQYASWKVEGIPAPQGSKRHVGMGRMIESCKALKPWREQIIAETRANPLVPQELDEAVSLSLVFLFPRPKAHFNSKGLLKPSAPEHKITKPDIDKLARAVLDSLTLAGVFRDDALVYSLTVQKRYCAGQEAPGVMITLMGTQQIDASNG
jgi:crossover junction endodeoxyribonuclease RusA